jgi:uncharacterized membrane protein YdjX (TVP38/TMEM64 family)
MRRFILFNLLILLFFLLLFGLATSSGLAFESFTGLSTTNGKWIAALLSVLLLIADFLLPVPSSLIMIGQGMLFGPLVGAALGLVGGMGASLFGYYAGKGSRRWLLRFIPEQELERAEQFFQRWGILAIAITRAIPLFAEVVSVAAGSAGVGLRQMVVNSLLGLLPVCLVYSVTGAYALEIDGGVWSFLLVIGTASFALLISRWLSKKVVAKSSAQ